jgi:hypothetical protein
LSASLSLLSSKRKGVVSVNLSAVTGMLPRPNDFRDTTDCTYSNTSSMLYGNGTR